MLNNFITPSFFSLSLKSYIYRCQHIDIQEALIIEHYN